MPCCVAPKPHLASDRMNFDAFVQSVELDSDPPEELSEELKSLWLAKKGKWHESHDIAQDIDSKLGSWIHALLHTMEGDLGNASYWFTRAGEPSIDSGQIDDEWARITKSIFSSS